MPYLPLALVLWSLLCVPAARAADWLPPATVGGQVTAVWQYKPSFRSPYQGPRSFRPRTEDAVSHSYTLYTGVRVLPWLDVYVDPEMIRGEGISGGIGLAGYTNGEVIRNPAAGQSPYLARAFLRATFPLGEETKDTEADLLQVGGAQATRRLTLTGGLLAAADIFDTNRYANSARTQFLNWSFINDTAWDFAADTRGYTRGGAVEWTADTWAVRLGAFQMPAVANGLDLDGDLLHAHGEQVEAEHHAALLPGLGTIVRLMAYGNQARMGDYGEALAPAHRRGAVPDVTLTRRRGRTKYGFTLNAEQPLTPDGETGLFVRAGWNDGATETFAYTEADWAASGGAQLDGALWKRRGDRIGLAMAANGLSDPHAEYLRGGGLGFELGDGKLSYRPETIFETYYALGIVPWATLTADYQLIADPGHNAARGPVSVISLRLHLQIVRSL